SRSLDSYSVAVQQIIAIARAVSLSGKVLILDEPTASLDRDEVRMLFDVVRSLRAEGLGIVFISHFLDQVFDISDRITVLRNGKLVGVREAATLDRTQLINMMLGRELSEETRDRGRGGFAGRLVVSPASCMVPPPWTPTPAKSLLSVLLPIVDPVPPCRRRALRSFRLLPRCACSSCRGRRGWSIRSASRST
ncbi:MAG TPA: hypothetical protein VM686_33210, partial [Polyangiaceae bacterium]|nr:hypothetical protein [Polyangiaceae bacterium]